MITEQPAEHLALQVREQTFALALEGTPLPAALSLVVRERVHEWRRDHDKAVVDEALRLSCRLTDLQERLDAHQRATKRSWWRW